MTIPFMRKACNITWCKGKRKSKSTSLRSQRWTCRSSLRQTQTIGIQWPAQSTHVATRLASWMVSLQGPAWAKIGLAHQLLARIGSIQYAVSAACTTHRSRCQRISSSAHRAVWLVRSWMRSRAGIVCIRMDSTSPMSTANGGTKRSNWWSCNASNGSVPVLVDSLSIAASIGLSGIVATIGLPGSDPSALNPPKINPRGGGGGGGVRFDAPLWPWEHLLQTKQWLTVPPCCNAQTIHMIRSGRNPSARVVAVHQWHGRGPLSAIGIRHEQCLQGWLVDCTELLP